MASGPGRVHAIEREPRDRPSGVDLAITREVRDSIRTSPIRKLPSTDRKHAPGLIGNKPEWHCANCPWQCEEWLRVPQAPPVPSRDSIAGIEVGDADEMTLSAIHRHHRAPEALGGSVLVESADCPIIVELKKGGPVRKEAIIDCKAETEAQSSRRAVV